MRTIMFVLAFNSIVFLLLGLGGRAANGFSCGGATAPQYHIPSAPGSGDICAIFEYGGTLHLMHQGWNHAFSSDGGAHWEQVVPNSALPVTGMDGSITVLEGSQGSEAAEPVMLFDCISTALCKPPSSGVGDPPIIGVARPSNLSDHTLANWSIDPLGPIVVHEKNSNKSVTVGFAGPSSLWLTTSSTTSSNTSPTTSTSTSTSTSTGGNVTNMVMWLNGSTALFQTTDPRLHSWTLANPSLYPKSGGGGALFYPLPGTGDETITQAGGRGREASTTTTTTASPLPPTHMLQTDLPGHGDGVTAFIFGVYNASTGSFTPSNNTAPSFLDGKYPFFFWWLSEGTCDTT